MTDTSATPTGDDEHRIAEHGLHEAVHRVQARVAAEERGDCLVRDAAAEPAAQQREDTPVDVRRQVVLEHTAQLAEQPHDDVRLPLLLDAARDGREHPHALGVAGVLAAHELPDERRDGERAVCLHHPLDDA